MALKKTLTSILGAGLISLAGMLTPVDARGTEDSLYVADVLMDQSNVGAESAIIRHKSNAVEGYDTRDGPWSTAPPSPYPTTLRAYTEPYGIELKTDSRAPESETLYQIKLKPNGATMSGTNNLCFTWGSAGSDPSRVYTAKIWIDGKYTPNSNDFLTVVDVRKVINENGGAVPLCGIVNVPDGTNYGTVDISCKFLKDPEIKKFSCDGVNATLETEVQSGSYTQDTIESKTNLTDSIWNPEQANSLEYVAPTALNFNSNEKRTYALPAGSETAKFYRIKRTESAE